LTIGQHNDIVVLVIPPFQPDGSLPPGIHWADWDEIVARFGWTAHRGHLLKGCLEAAKLLKKAGCKTLYVDGSFVTSKEMPGDYDACWGIDGVDSDRLHPVFLDFTNLRAAQKALFQGEFFPADIPEGISGKTFLEFFQRDKESGEQKGIVALDMEAWKP
jgi:hypothetical protein